jgi:hypothetical protein
MLYSTVSRCHIHREISIPGDDKSIVDSSMYVYASLHKRHNMHSLYKEREAIASGMIIF